MRVPPSSPTTNISPNAIRSTRRGAVICEASAYGEAVMAHGRAEQTNAFSLTDTKRNTLWGGLTMHPANQHETRALEVFQTCLPFRFLVVEDRYSNCKNNIDCFARKRHLLNKCNDFFLFQFKRVKIISKSMTMRYEYLRGDGWDHSYLRKRHPESISQYIEVITRM